MRLSVTGMQWQIRYQYIPLNWESESILGSVGGWDRGCQKFLGPAHPSSLISIVEAVAPYIPL